MAFFLHSQDCPTSTDVIIQRLDRVHSILPSWPHHEWDHTTRLGKDPNNAPDKGGHQVGVISLNKGSEWGRPSTWGNAVSFLIILWQTSAHAWWFRLKLKDLLRYKRPYSNMTVWSAINRVKQKHSPPTAVLQWQALPGKTVIHRNYAHAHEEACMQWVHLCTLNRFQSHAHA